MNESTWPLGEKIFKYKAFVAPVGLFQWLAETF